MKRILVSLCLIMTSIGIVCAQVPSISSIITAFSARSNIKPVAEMLEASGYTYRFETSGYQSVEYVFSKNCQVIHEEYSNGVEYVPSPETANSSIITVNTSGDRVISISVNAYSSAIFRKWVSQLKTLGYRSTSDSGSGNRGRSWEYVSRGKPKISIWNDYSNTYVLYIGN